MSLKKMATMKLGIGAARGAAMLGLAFGGPSIAEAPLDHHLDHYAVLVVERVGTGTQAGGHGRDR